MEDGMSPAGTLATAGETPALPVLLKRHRFFAKKTKICVIEVRILRPRRMEKAQDSRAG